jgi:hypothetical protein
VSRVLAIINSSTIYGPSAQNHSQSPATHGQTAMVVRGHKHNNSQSRICCVARIAGGCILWVCTGLVQAICALLEVLAYTVQLVWATVILSETVVVVVPRVLATWHRFGVLGVCGFVCLVIGMAAVPVIEDELNSGRPHLVKNLVRRARIIPKIILITCVVVALLLISSKGVAQYHHQQQQQQQQQQPPWKDASSQCVSHYYVLHVPEDCTMKQLRKAYIKASLEWHPDRIGAGTITKQSAHEAMIRINDAYSLLKNENKRAMYDKWMMLHKC